MKTYVNVGCGSNIVKSTKDIKWINIDNFYLPESKDFTKGDILDIPLESNSVDYVMADQVLEHLAMADVTTALYEMRRILKKGGRCVLMVPDFEGAARQWLDQNFNATFDPMKYMWFSEVIYGNQMHPGEFHKTPMCARYLHEMLKMVGFHNATITFWPAFGKIPEFPGMRPYAQTATLRNAQLMVDVIK